MTVAYWCVLLAGLLPYVAAAIAKKDRQYDNADPRGWMEKQQGFKRRAHYGTIDSLASAFIVVRCIYIATYISNKATLRSLVWPIGMIIVLAIFFAAASR